MIRKLVILGLLALLVGTAALAWALAAKRKEQKRAAYYTSKHDSELSEYLKQYKEWLSASGGSPEERAKLLVGPDKYGKTKTYAQLLQEQKERLKADLDKLATGEIDAHPYADVLYGENWQKELSKYKKQKELREAILTGSIVCASMGVVIVTGCLLICAAQPIIRRVPRLRRFSTDTFRNQRGRTEVNNPAETSTEGSRKAGSQIYEENPKILLTQLLDLRDLPQKPPATSSPNITTIQIEDSLKYQVEHLEKRVEEIRQMAGDSFLQEAIKCQSAKSDGPLNDTLVELTQQVAAIREYASVQQDRVNKLQDGYDLNIIKNFCIRIIRCIDNLESCINYQSEQNSETMHLKEARDELLFALESSGVEQFEPEINSDYQGQERRAEAVKDKEPFDDPNLAGRIAKVIKPGYHYFIDEENIKVVRPAMVKLFG